MPKFLKYHSFLLGEKMQGFRHHGQDLMKFAKLELYIFSTPIK
jgi:hypothetical protein